MSEQVLTTSFHCRQRADERLTLSLCNHNEEVSSTGVSVVVPSSTHTLEKALLALLQISPPNLRSSTVTPSTLTPQPSTSLEPPPPNSDLLHSHLSIPHFRVVMSSRSESFAFIPIVHTPRPTPAWGTEASRGEAKTVASTGWTCDREGEYGPVFSGSVSSEVFCLRWISHLRGMHFVHESSTNETSFPLVLITSDFIKSDGQLRLPHLAPTLRCHLPISSGFQSFTYFLSADAPRSTLFWRTEASLDEGTTVDEASTGVKMCGCKWAWACIDVADFEPFYTPLRSGPDQVQQTYHSCNNPDSSVQSLLPAYQTFQRFINYSPWQLSSKSHSDIYLGVRDSRRLICVHPILSRQQFSSFRPSLNVLCGNSQTHSFEYINVDLHFDYLVFFRAIASGLWVKTLHEFLHAAELVSPLMTVIFQFVILVVSSVPSRRTPVIRLSL